MDQVLMLSHKVQETQDHFHTSPKREKFFFPLSIRERKLVALSVLYINEKKIYSSPSLSMGCNLLPTLKDSIGFQCFAAGLDAEDQFLTATLAT